MSLLDTHIPYLSTEEQALIDACSKEMEKYNIEIPFLILMSVRQYYRTKNDLVSILCEYPGLGNKDELRDCITACIAKGFLREKTIADITICYQDQECLQKFYDLQYIREIDQKINVVEKIETLRNKYANHTNCTIYGHLSGGETSGNAYLSFIARLKSARQQIWLPMINTDTHTDTIKVLKERAEHGVKIYILMANNKIVDRFRGGNNYNRKKWIAEFKNVPNVKIRTYSKQKYSQLGSCVLIDNAVLRLAIFDYQRQKSTEGMLVEFFDPDVQLNIVNMFQEKLICAWIDSSPFYEKKEIWAYLILLALIGILVKFNNISNIQSIICSLIASDITYICMKQKELLSDFFTKCIQCFKR